MLTVHCAATGIVLPLSAAPRVLLQTEHGRKEFAYHWGYNDALKLIPFGGDRFKHTEMLKTYKDGYEDALGHMDQAEQLDRT